MTNVEVVIRLAKRSEAAEIATLSRAIVEYGLEWAWRPARVAAGMRNRSTHVLIARVADETAGFAIMRYGDDEAHLDLFGVVPHYRRMGIGRQLLDWLEKCVRVAGISRIVLEVRAGNQGAQAFYERMGYRRRGSLPRYYQGVETAIRMVHEIANLAAPPPPLHFSTPSRPRRR